MKRNKYKTAMQKVRFSRNFDEETLHAMMKAETHGRKVFRWEKFAVIAAAVLIVASAAMLTTAVLRKPDDLPVEPFVTPVKASDEQAVDPAAEAAAEEPSGKGNSTLLLSINPEIEFQIDGEGTIISVVGTNEDGAALLEGIDLAGQTFENAATVVTNRLLEEGYITANEIAETITMTLGGENKNPELIEEMSGIITSVAERYAIEIETEQTAEDTILLALKKEPEEELPFLPAEQLEQNPDMTVEFILTGNVNDETTVGWQDAEGGGRVFGAGYTEIDTIKFKNGDEVYSAFDVFEYDTMGSEWLNAAVMQTMNSMIKKGYLTNESLHRVVGIVLRDCTEKQYAEAREMVSMMLQQANLYYLDIRDGSKGDSMLIVNLKDAPGIINPKYIEEKMANSHEAKYTLDELMDIRRSKDPAEITDLQMRILTLALTEDGAKEKLVSRAWKVVPNLIGLTEKEAMALCKQAGVTAEPVYEYVGWFDEESKLTNPESFIGKVFYQDAPTGSTVEENVPFQINIVVDDESKAS